MQIPPFIFLIGPSGSGKTTLARLMAENSERIAHCSFDEPIREATLQLFYPDQMHLGIDLRDSKTLQTNIPYTNVEVHDWLKSFRAILNSISLSLIGDLAKRRAEFVAQSYSCFIYDDTPNPESVLPFARAYGQQNCLLVFLERVYAAPLSPSLATYLQRFEGTFLPRLVVKNPEGNPEQMLQAFKEG